MERTNLKNEIEDAVLIAIIVVAVVAWVIKEEVCEIWE